MAATFDFTVHVQAETKDEAKQLLGAALKLMKSAKTQMTSKEFSDFANKIEEKPGLIKTAKKFVL